MNRQIQQMLQSLREAIHEALADSPGIAAAMAELEREGRSPTFRVDVALPEETDVSSPDLVYCDGQLALTSFDEDFLRNMGIATTLA